MFLPSNITLKFGDSGDFVSELQRRLAAVHCFDANAINGFYDGVTVNGVSQFQSMSGIRADGIAGPETLRRLNGVISGDNSSTTDHKAEEEKRQQQELSHRQQLEQQYLYEQQALLAQQQQQQAYAAQMQAQANAQSYTPQPLAPQPQTALPEVSYAQPPVYQAQQPAYQPQPVPSAGDDVLARMLLGQQPQQQQALAAAPQPLAQQPAYTTPPPQAYAAVPPAALQAHAQPPVAAQYIPPSDRPIQPGTQQDPNMPQTQAVETPTRGIVGRAIQFMNEKIQQLHQYFEAKLPNHVMNEVKAIGMVLAQNGVKEAAIPTGPEPQRGVEGPQRGQQQSQQRG
jgi:peptidoglycan hydrolase-like protein with peptidoglycan-binding domain